MKKKIYRVHFINQGKVYEVYAREVSQSSLFGFLEVARLEFATGGLVIDPSEERLQQEFAGVERFYVPVHAVIRIDEVDKGGAAKIHALDGAQVMPFPGMPSGSATPSKGGD